MVEVNPWWISLWFGVSLWLGSLHGGVSPWLGSAHGSPPAHVGWGVQQLPTACAGDPLPGGTHVFS